MSAAKVKVCGITRIEDAMSAVDAGVELIGLNFVPSSPRCIDVSHAKELVRVIAGRAEVIGVVANLEVLQLNELRQAAHLDTLQLHGDEPPEVFRLLAANDYKAIRVAEQADVELARRFPGARLLVDAKVSGALGGSGHTFDWSLVAGLARERQLILAGGLTPANVALAAATVRPWALDVASGVESAPGIKSSEKMAAFVAGASGF